MTTNTKTVSTSSTVDSLVGALRSHLLGRTLPAPASVNINVRCREISIQPDGSFDIVGRLSSLLLWAHTLTDVTATWWHTDEGRLHISVRGRTGGGVRLDVYAGVAFAECRGLVPLELGQSEGVSLDELYALVGLLREAQERRAAS